jgi:phage terminase large subunit
LAENEKQIARYQAIEYRWYRKENSYLWLDFADRRKLRLPTLDLRPYQLEVQDALWNKGTKRFFLVRPRRSGKEVESWNMLIQGAVTEPGLYMMIYPTNVRARLVLWEGAITMPNGRSLRFLDMIPSELLAGNPNNADMSINFKNGSIIRVIGSDIDPDKLRGVNVRGAAFSEYAYSDPRVLHILMPVFRQNNGWFILQTTFNGQNHAYRFMQEIKDNPDWYCRVDSIETLIDSKGQRYVTDDMIEDDRRSGMPEFMIQQEYYSVIQLNQETLYFANELNYLYKSERIIPELYLPDRRVRMHMDIGWNDKTACVLEQNDEIGNPNIISYTENNNKAFEYYIRWAEGECNQLGLLLSEIYAPHDGQKHDFNTGKNTVDFGRDLGYNVYIVPKPTSKFNAIQSMRRMIPRAKFNKEKTKRLLECLSNYSKEFDTKRGVYKDEPLHNWASHGVDSFQTMTLAYEAQMIKSMPRDIFYING